MHTLKMVLQVPELSEHKLYRHTYSSGTFINQSINLWLTDDDANKGANSLLSLYTSSKPVLKCKQVDNSNLQNIFKISNFLNEN